jgi:sarcosine oxidase subunit beta
MPRHMTTIEADVAIVGGGLIGCMTAYYLAKRGRSVVVLERALIGGASSGVSFGSLRLQGQHGPGLPMALRSQALWEGIEAELGESVSFVQKGHVHLAVDEAQVARLEENADHLRPAGLEVELLDRSEAIRRWPFLGAQIRAASWSRRDAVVNPRLVTPAFARVARRLGAIICDNAAVIGAEHVAGRFAIRVGYGAGGDGLVCSEILVNAGGAWCGEVASWFGETIPALAAGPAELVTEPVPAFVDPVMHVVDGSVLFRQTARGNVIIGGHPRLSVELTGQRARVPPEKIATNLARLVAIAPHMRAYHVIRSWTGIEGYLPDMMPVFGLSDTTPGLFHACAFSGHGLQAGPAAASALAELIVDGATSLPIASFAIGRFRTGQAAAVQTMDEEFHDDVLRQGGLR